MHARVFARLRESLDADRSVILATALGGPHHGAQLLIWPDGETEGDLGSPSLEHLVAQHAATLFSSFDSQRKSFVDGADTFDIFFDVHPARRKLVLVGAVHVALPLIHYAKRLGFFTVVIDPRTAFATHERFAEADRLMTEWPQKALRNLELNESTFFAVLSHDMKLDLPALEIALRSTAPYIGALGSKRTHAKRIAALRELGFGEQDLARIRAPIGLDLGGRSAEEMALAIMAQIVAALHGRAK